jgi:hypothetical protein
MESKRMSYPAGLTGFFYVIGLGIASFCFLRQTRQSGKNESFWQDFCKLARFWQSGKYT